MNPGKKRLTKRGLSDNNRHMDQRELEETIDKLRRQLHGAEVLLDKLATVEKSHAKP